MGLKFLGSTTVGSIPTNNLIEEREIAINLSDGKIYTRESELSVPTDGTTAGIIALNGEIAGRLWKATDSYLLGDLVTDGSIPAVTFIALADNINSPLPAGGGTNASWQELDSIFYNALSGGDRNGDGVLDLTDGNIIGEGGVMHCPWNSTSGEVYDPLTGYVSPNMLGEYPNTALNGTEAGFEKIGAIWYISGLGATDNVPHEYAFATGPLAGQRVRDNDKVVWVDGATGAEVWLWSPFPRISGERGGILWSSSREYVIGDIVMFNGIGYHSLSGTPLIPNNGNQPDLPASVTDWKTLSGSVERAGLAYDPTVQYEIGDTFTYNGKVYVVGDDPTRIGTQPPPAPGPADPTDIVTNPEWGGIVEAGGAEVGGVIYDAGITYKIGDIVSSGLVPDVAWISIANANTGNPLILSAWWQELDSIFYTAGSYTPVAGDEYPDNALAPAPGTIGAVWYVNGLGVDVNDDPNLYEFLTGNLAGMKVQDSDKIIWIDGAITAETWLWSPFPRISGEVGGIAWTSGKRYVIGDTVTEANKQYIAITGLNALPNVGNLPSTSPTNWKLVGDSPVTTNIANPGNPGTPSVDAFAVSDRQMMVVDTAGLVLTPGQTAYSLTLPAAPLDEESIWIVDGAGNAQNVPVLVLANGKLINGIVDDLTCDVNFFDIKLVFNIATGSWALGGK